MPFGHPEAAVAAADRPGTRRPTGGSGGTERGGCIIGVCVGSTATWISPTWRQTGATYLSRARKAETAA